MTGCPQASSLRVFVLNLIFFLVVFSLVYWAALFFNFGFHDDYTIFDFSGYNHPYRSCCFYIPETVEIFRIGRPIFSLLLNLIFLPVTKISHLQYVRGISILFLAVSSAWLAVLLSRNTSLSRNGSVATAALIGLLPGAQIFVVWSFFVAGSISYFIVIAILAFAERIPITAAMLRTLWTQPRVLANTAVLVLFLALSFAIYTPSTTFFLAIPLAGVLFPKQTFHQSKIKSIYYLLIFLVSSFVYFLAMKLVILPIATKIIWPGLPLNTGAYSFSIAENPFDKVNLIIHEYLPNIVSLWDAEQLAWPGPVIAVVLLIGMTISLWRWGATLRSTPWIITLGTALLVIGLLAGSLLPLIANKGTYLSNYRVLFTAQAMCILLFAWACSEIWLVIRNAVWSHLRTVCVLIFLVFVGALASRNLYEVARTANREIEFIGTKLTQNLAANHRHLTLIEPTSRKELGHRLALEFTHLTGPITGMIHAVMREIGRDPAQFETIFIRTGTADFYANKNSLVIDLYDAWPDLFPEDSRAKLIGTISTNATSNCCPVSLAFDGSLVGWSFWETHGPWPIEVIVEYSKETVVREYKFSTSDWGLKDAKDQINQLMPRRFKLEGWVDGGPGWVTLDERVDEHPWQLNETRSYPVSVPRPLTKYRLTLLEGNSPKLRMFEIAFSFAESSR
jgi:hypothetical protein